jgi:hypothetical protein
MTNDEKIQRASRAQALMSDPLMVEAMEHIEAECWRLFRLVSPEDTNALQQIKSMQYMHDKYRAFLKDAIDTGKMAQFEIDHKRARPAGY